MKKYSPSIWQYVVTVKLTVKISSINAAYLENMNFNINFYLAMLRKNIVWFEII